MFNNLKFISIKCKHVYMVYIYWLKKNGVSHFSFTPNVHEYLNLKKMFLVNLLN